MQLARFDRLRAIKISADLANGYTMGEAVEWFENTIARELPSEATLDWDGQTREFTRTGQQLYFTFLLALAVVYLVLAAQFESFVHPLIIMVTVPLALLGAVFGLKLFGLTINIFSQIAVIMLIGIAAKNGVLIVEFANQLRDRGIEFVDAIVQAAVTRLRPVLMTSLCTAFGALPLMLATGAGAEQRRPIGIVVFFGMTVAVFLTLFAVPTVYALCAQDALAAAREPARRSTHGRRARRAERTGSRRITRRAPRLIRQSRRAALAPVAIAVALEQEVVVRRFARNTHVRGVVGTLGGLAVGVGRAHAGPLDLDIVAFVGVDRKGRVLPALNHEVAASRARDRALVDRHGTRAAVAVGIEQRHARRAGARCAHPHSSPSSRIPRRARRRRRDKSNSAVASACLSPRAV